MLMITALYVVPIFCIRDATQNFSEFECCVKTSCITVVHQKGIGSYTLCEPVCQTALCCVDVCIFSVHSFNVVLLLFCNRTDLLK